MNRWLIVLVLFLFKLIPCHGSDSTQLSPHLFYPKKFRTAPSYTFNFTEDTSSFYQPVISVYLGGFHAFSRSKLAINSEQLEGTMMDTEKNLGLKEKKIIPRLELIFVPFRRQEIHFLYYTIRRKATDSLPGGINFGDHGFLPKTPVTTKLNFSQYALTYRYRFLSERGCHAGLSFGGRLYNLDTRLQAHLNGHSFSAEANINAPAPMVGVHATIHSLRHFVVRGSAEYFRLDRRNWGFETIDVRAGIEYYPASHIGIGVDLHYFNTDIERIPSGKLNGRIKYSFAAASLYTGIRF